MLNTTSAVLYGFCSSYALNISRMWVKTKIFWCILLYKRYSKTNSFTRNRLLHLWVKHLCTIPIGIRTVTVVNNLLKAFIHLSIQVSIDFVHPFNKSQYFTATMRLKYAYLFMQIFFCNYAHLQIFCLQLIMIRLFYKQIKYLMIKYNNYI